MPREEIIFCLNTKRKVTVLQETVERRERKSTPDVGNMGVKTQK